MYKLIIFIFILVFTNCKKVDNQNDSIKVSNLIISKLGKIPELKPSKNDTLYNSKLDSLNLAKKSNLSVGIYPYYANKSKIADYKIPEGFEFINKISDTVEAKEPVPFNSFVSNEYNLTVLNLSKATNFEKTPIFLVLSKVYFNKNNNKAVIQCTRTKGKLQSGTLCYFLKKKNNKWIVVSEELLTIS